MFNEYYNKLVLKYIGGKKFLQFFCLKCLKCVVFYNQIFSLFFLGKETKSTKTDNGISQALRNSDKISVTKNIFDGSVEINITAERSTSFKQNTTNIWKNFKEQPCNFSVEKANLQENSILYVNEAYQSYKDNKKVYYADYYLLGQGNQYQNPPEDLKNYECKPNEAKFYRPNYDTVTGKFLGLYETLGYLTVRGEKGECFFDYGYSKENSKMRIANSFSGTMFNRHRIQFESGALNTEFSKIYLFLPSITDRIDSINRDMGSVHLVQIDIPEDSFEVEGS